MHVDVCGEPHLCCGMPFRSSSHMHQRQHRPVLRPIPPLGGTNLKGLRIPLPT